LPHFLHAEKCPPSPRAGLNSDGRQMAPSMKLGSHQEAVARKSPTSHAAKAPLYFKSCVCFLFQHSSSVQGPLALLPAPQQTAPPKRLQRLGQL